MCNLIMHVFIDLLMFSLIVNTNIIYVAYTLQIKDVLSVECLRRSTLCLHLIRFYFFKLFSLVEVSDLCRCL
jgi:hypothetical protein